MKVSGWVNGIVLLLACMTSSCASQKVTLDTRSPAAAQNATAPIPAQVGKPLSVPQSVPPIDSVPSQTAAYTLGVDDVIQVDLVKPEPLTVLATVAPDGAITFPYIGKVMVKGQTVIHAQEEIQSRLADGYMKYPVVSVLLKESRSRKFFVYGEVIKPGAYSIDENLTVLRAISMAGGFTRFGSASRVKILRPQKNGPGYVTVKVDIKAIMEGALGEDAPLSQGDIVVVSEGMF